MEIPDVPRHQGKTLRCGHAGTERQERDLQVHGGGMAPSRMLTLPCQNRPGCSKARSL